MQTGMDDQDAPPQDSAQNALMRSAGGHRVAGGDQSRLQLLSLAELPLQLDVRVPVPNFRVSDLVSLRPGTIVASGWPGSEDLPLSCGDVQLLWTEFEVVDQALAVRVTRLV